MDIEFVKENFPFITVIKCRDITYVGIVQNTDEKLLSFYDFDSIKTTLEKKTFLELGDRWWNESNRLLPISIFLGLDMVHFKYCIKTISCKETEILLGPVTSLQELIKKRTKKKQIQLVRRM